MPEKWTIQEVTTKQIGDMNCWRVRMLRADGKPHMHTEPKQSLDWRAAEYGIDPADTDTLLEIILHEPFMAMTEETDTQASRYADGPTLWEAESTDAAREALFTRVKNCPVRIDIRGVAALDVIRSSHQPDPERLRAMRELVDTNRWIALYGDLPVRPNPTLEVPRA